MCSESNSSLGKEDDLDWRTTEQASSLRALRCRLRQGKQQKEQKRRRKKRERKRQSPSRTKSSGTRNGLSVARRFLDLVLAKARNTGNGSVKRKAWAKINKKIIKRAFMLSAVVCPSAFTPFRPAWKWFYGGREIWLEHIPHRGATDITPPPLLKSLDIKEEATQTEESVWNVMADASSGDWSQVRMRDNVAWRGRVWGVFGRSPLSSPPGRDLLMQTRTINHARDPYQAVGNTQTKAHCPPSFIPFGTKGYLVSEDRLPQWISFLVVFTVRLRKEATWNFYVPRSFWRVEKRKRKL